MVSGYPVLDGQSRSQFTSSSASTTLLLAAIGLHSEETVSHTFPHCAANAAIANVRKCVVCLLKYMIYVRSIGTLKKKKIKIQVAEFLEISKDNTLTDIAK